MSFITGFNEIASIELDNEPWQFNILALFEKEGQPGKYYLTTDSGCSCPTPFESHTADDLTGPLTAEQAREESESLIRIAEVDDWCSGPNADDVEEFLSAIV